MPPTNKRLQVMAGPNGSGKSTILKEVPSKFYSGPFVNAGDIEKTLQGAGFVNLNADYNLEIADDAFEKFLKNEGRNWVSKSIAEGPSISLFYSKGRLVSKKA